MLTVEAPEQLTSTGAVSQHLEEEFCHSLLLRLERMVRRGSGRIVGIPVHPGLFGADVETHQTWRDPTISPVG